MFHKQDLKQPFQKFLILLSDVISSGVALG